MTEDQEAERLISFYSAGETGFTEFNVQPDGEGDFYSMQAGNEESYEFDLDRDTAEEYRNRLVGNLRNGTALKQSMGNGDTQVTVYSENGHQTGELTNEGKEVVNEMIEAFEENKQ
jgi:hypothetical protein